MSTREQLVRRVRELADGSPYVVEDTAEGFDVRVARFQGRVIELGFEEHQGTAAGIGLVVGIIGAVGAVLTIVVLLVVWLSGVQFS